MLLGKSHRAVLGRPPPQNAATEGVEMARVRAPERATEWIALRASLAALLVIVCGAIPARTASGTQPQIEVGPAERGQPPTNGEATLSSIAVGGGGAETSSGAVRAFIVVGEPAIGEAFGTVVDLALGVLAAAGSDSTAGAGGLVLTVVDSDTSAVAGEPLDWTVRVTNTGNSPETFDWVVAEAPPGTHRADLWGTETMPRPRVIPPLTTMERSVSRTVPLNAPAITDLIVRTVMLLEGRVVAYDSFETDIIPAFYPLGMDNKSMASPAAGNDKLAAATAGDEI